MEIDSHDVGSHWLATKSELIAAAAEAGVTLIEKSSEYTAEVLAEAGSSGSEKRKGDLYPRRPRPWANEAEIVHADDEPEEHSPEHMYLMLRTLTSTRPFKPGVIVLTPTEKLPKGGKSKCDKNGIAPTGCATRTAFPLTPSTSPSGRAVTRTQRPVIRTMVIESNLVF